MGDQGSGQKDGQWREIAMRTTAVKGATGWARDRRMQGRMRLICATLLITAGMASSLSAQAQAMQQGNGVQSVTGTPENLPALPQAQSAQTTQVTTVQASASPAPAPASMAPAADNSADTGPAGGNVAELQRRIANKELSELRTVYNGSYGASLLMANSDPTYYVALFERKNFWRVIKTQNDVQAEAVFADFSRQTFDLGSAEIRTFRLEAQKRSMDALIALNESRTRQIQADLAVKQTQEKAVAERQQQALAQAAAQDAENRQARLQLVDLQRQIDDLQKQANAGLPPLSRKSKP